MQCNKQAVHITTHMKVKINVTLPELSVAKILTCNFHVNVSAKGRYDIILGRDMNRLLITLHHSVFLRIKFLH